MLLVLPDALRGPSESSSDRHTEGREVLRATHPHRVYVQGRGERRVLSIVGAAEDGRKPQSQRVSRDDEPGPIDARLQAGTGTGTDRTHGAGEQEATSTAAAAATTTTTSTSTTAAATTTATTAVTSATAPTASASYTGGARGQGAHTDAA